MHITLSKYLEKIGLKKLEDATPEEKQTFDRWNEILSEKDITVKDIEHLCAFEKGEIEKMWSNVNNAEKLNERLILLHTIWSKIEGAINPDTAERDALEEHIEKLMLDTDT